MGNLIQISSEEVGFLHSEWGYFQTSVVRYKDSETGEEVEIGSREHGNAKPFPVKPSGDHMLNEEGNGWVKRVVSAEELRAAMPSITKRQLRLTLVRNDIPLGMVIAAIAGMEEGLAKEEATIEWDAATEFTRLNPVLLNIAAALSLTPEKVDTLWEQALAA